MPFGQGQVYRNGARPLGARNRRTTEAIEAIIAAGHQDPLLTLAELQAKSADEGIRATAANMLAPFLHSKCAAVPAPRYIENPFTFPYPHPKSPQEVDANTAAINQGFADEALSYEATQLLLAGQREFIVSFKAREELPGSQDIHVTGGLPIMPGHENLIMPKLNGNVALGLVAPNDPPITPPEDVDAPPAIPPEQQDPTESINNNE